MLSALFASALSAFSSAALADNPIVQTNYTADPAPMVHDGRLYLYTSHDEDVTVNDFFTMNDWRVYSTLDMVNWTDHGSPASYRTFSWGTGDAWAPHGIARNGKFYLYVPINNSTGAKIGVAVSDSPFGPFTDPLGTALISGGSGNIDPVVFIDDDEQAYLYWGNPDLWYVKLNSNMTSYEGSPTKVNLTTAGFGTRSNTDRPTAYEEGPWFYKRDALYYLVFPADGIPEKISYSTSSGALGPWTFGGDIMAEQTGARSSFTNHPGVIDYQGKSYFFYHNGALPGGGSYKRSVCVEEFTYGNDGKIPTITMSNEGPAPIRTLNPFQQVEAETIAFSSGLKTETCTDDGGGINVTSINAGDYIKLKNVDLSDGVTSFEARVSAAAGDAKIEVHLDSQNGTLLGTCDVSGSSAWTTKTCSFSGGEGGTHDLFLTFTGGSGELFKFNWWKVSGPTMPDPSGGAGGQAGGGGGSGTSGSAGGAGIPQGGQGGSAGGMGGGGNAGAGVSGSAGRLGAGSGGVASGNGGANTSAGVGGAAGGSGGAPTSGRGGSSAGSGTSSSGAPATTDTTDSDSGCACRASSGRSHAPPLAALLVLGLGLRRRSRNIRRG